MSNIGVGKALNNVSLTQIVNDLGTEKSSKHIQYDKGTSTLYTSSSLLGSIKNFITNHFSKTSGLSDKEQERGPTMMDKQREHRAEGSKMVIQALKDEFGDVAKAVIKSMKNDHVNLRDLTAGDVRDMYNLAHELRRG